MFAFTTKSRYGLSAILEMAKNYGNAPLHVKEIAARHGISPQYLEQLMIRLAKPGLIRAVRGQKGGFVLARPPQGIALIDVLEALEGPLAITQTMPADNALTEYAMEAEAALRRTLDVPLSDVLARQDARAMMFHI
jgi:Rrf2 family transcriptional regulator, cysteine metabolism repressor